MRIKRFSAKDLPGVVALIKKEFGLAAVILSQRENPETGEVEVTAGVREEDLAPAETAVPPGTPRGASAGAPAKEGKGEGDFDGLLRQAERAGPEEPPPPKDRASPSGSQSGAARSRRPGATATSATSAANAAIPAIPGAAPGVVPGAGRRATTLAARDLKPARPGAPSAGLGARGVREYQKNEARGREARGLESVGAAHLEKSLADLRLDVDGKLGELKNLLLDLAHRQSLSEKWRDRGDLVALYRRLLATGLEQELARDFAEMAAESLEAWGGDLADHLKKTVRPLIKTLPGDGIPARCVSFVGPAGSGKTSSLMKLATLRKQKGEKVSLVSLDTLKLGASEQLTKFARIMGLGLKICQNGEEFREARELFLGSDRIFVDTSARDILSPSPKRDLAAALAEGGTASFLTLPATMKTRDLEAAHKAAGGPFLLGVILTRIDETGGLGNVFNFAKHLGPIFAYFSLGHKTPEEFTKADPDKLTELWLAKG
ncbi:MAG: hypothetical protein LBF41_07530 [Deltaproteobacteria bacterium]|jgi:flagellar biosynthesis protein FlhF|nr:hypothetical protein [Deltaproteobacteria bacterium]